MVTKTWTLKYSRVVTVLSRALGTQGSGELPQLLFTSDIPLAQDSAAGEGEMQKLLRLFFRYKKQVEAL